MSTTAMVTNTYFPGDFYKPSNCYMYPSGCSTCLNTWCPSRSYVYPYIYPYSSDTSVYPLIVKLDVQNFEFEQKDDNLFVYFNVAGFAREDLTLDIDNTKIVVKGHSKTRDKTIELACDLTSALVDTDCRNQAIANIDGLCARYDSGLLIVSIPLKNNKKQIEIKNV